MILKLLLLPFRAVYAILRAVLFPWYLRWIMAFPWFVYLGLAVWVGSLAYQEYEAYDFGLLEADLQVEEGQPALTPLSQWNPNRDVSNYDEVMVEGLYFTAMPMGQFDPLGLEQGFVLLADELGREIKAALVVRPDDLPALQQMLARQGTGSRHTVTVNGMLSRNTEWADLIATELYILNVPAAQEIVVIRPFLNSRASEIYGAAADQWLFVLIVAGIAGLLVAVAVGKATSGTPKKRSYGIKAPAKRAAAKAAMDKPVPTTRPQETSPWDGGEVSFISQPVASAHPAPAKPKPVNHDEVLPAVEPAFESVFPGGGSGFRFKTTDQIIRETFGTVSRMPPVSPDTE